MPAGESGDDLLDQDFRRRCAGRDAERMDSGKCRPLDIGGTLDEKRREAEKQALLDALAQARNNRTLAARLLGVSRRTLYNKLEEFGIA